MRKLKCFVVAISVSATMVVYTQNINQNVNQNVNNNTFVIQNQPVIEKREYIVKYRTVYRDRPQPKRVARRLSQPICLLGYLWVYPEDLGTYEYGPSDIIYQINRQEKFGRNTWRVPTDDELRLMENYANQCGLGDDIYLSTSHRNGVLRLVSTGKSVYEQNKETEEKMQQMRAVEARRQAEEEQMRRDAQLRAQAAHQASISAQNSLVYSGNAVFANNILWKTKNKGATTPFDKGFITSDLTCSDDWRLPTEGELKAILNQSIKNDSYYKHPSGLIIPFGIYAITKRDGSIGYIMLPERMLLSGKVQTMIRFVQNKIY